MHGLFGGRTLSSIILTRDGGRKVALTLFGGELTQYFCQNIDCAIHQSTRTEQFACAVNNTGKGYSVTRS